MSWLAVLVLINEVQTDICTQIISINILKRLRDARNLDRQCRNKAYIKSYEKNNNQ